MVIEKTIKITRSRSGIPCLWESLTAFDNLTRATVILSSQGAPKKAFYLNENREKQALVPIVENDYIAKAFRDSNGIAISVFRINSISTETNEAEIVPVYRKSSLIDEEVPAEYVAIVDYTLKKLDNGKVFSTKKILV